MAEKWVRGDLERLAGAIKGSGQEFAVGGFAIVKGNACRRIAAPHWRPVNVFQLQHGTELKGGDAADFAVALSEQQFSRFVEEHEDAPGVDQEHWRRQVGSELASEDERKARLARRASVRGHGCRIVTGLAPEPRSSRSSACELRHAGGIALEHLIPCRTAGRPTVPQPPREGVVDDDEAQNCCGLRRRWKATPPTSPRATTGKRTARGASGVAAAGSTTPGLMPPVLQGAAGTAPGSSAPVHALGPTEDKDGLVAGAMVAGVVGGVGPEPGAELDEYACTSTTSMDPPGEVEVGTVRQPESALLATCRFRRISYPSAT